MSGPFTPARVRLLEKVSPEPNSGCWLWEGGISSSGYGMIGVGRKSLLVHRLSFEIHCGPIPEGMHIDHKCRNRICVNPDHLQAVSQAENNRLIVKYGANRNRLKTHCPKGHMLFGSNLISRPNGGRGCRACHSESNARWRAKKRKAPR